MIRSQRKKRDLLTLLDLEPKEIEKLLSRASQFKGMKPGSLPGVLKGKVLGLFFEKLSTRTRISFEVAAFRLGGGSIFLSSTQMQLSRGEVLQDTVRVLSRYLDGIVVRTFSQETIEQWARHAGIPVINGLTDLHHPCQVLGDLFTMREKLGELAGRKIAYVGDGNNVAHSLMEGAAAAGMQIALACPKGYLPDPRVVERARGIAGKTKARIEVVTDPEKAVRGADVIYTDVWTSMGQEDEASERTRRFQKYRVDKKLLAAARREVVVMHCLPAHRGEEITDEVLEGPRSAVWDQAENRLYTQMALLELLMGES
jgi:ornithine carbamoyltransferase